MKKLFLITLVFAMTLTLGFGIALAGNDAPSGPHYNLNIIGVEKGKDASMTGSHRHTIFVALGNKDGAAVKTNIYLTEGDFRVCDGNGFDSAYSCELDEYGDPVQIGRSDGAVFQLPANGCWLEDCVSPSDQIYEVYVRAVGTPGGNGDITTCIEIYDDAGDFVEKVCSSETVILVRNAEPNNARPKKFVNVTKELTTIKADLDGNGTEERYGLFHNDLWQYLWEYNNKGLKMVQLRFYNIADINKY